MAFNRSENWTEEQVDSGELEDKREKVELRGDKIQVSPCRGSSGTR